MTELYNKADPETLRRRLEASDENRLTLSFYQYHHIDDPHSFRDEIYQRFSAFDVLGRIYVAEEGINAQMSVPEKRFDHFKDNLYSIPWLKGVRLNVAIEHAKDAFIKLTVKVRPKIVADGLNDESFDVTEKGEHIDAEAFNELTERDETVVVDMRNHYESEVGHFRDAVTPDVETFREALPKVINVLSDKKDKPVIMYCTGGIRCEKASAYLKHNGFKKVYQLDGGIIEYARQVRKKGLENKYIGKNFVFDERLGERISEEVIAHCHQCGKPCDRHVNCANDACHILFIQCEECAEKHNDCCSDKCSDFLKLPEEERKALRKTEVFNGTLCGKGRYRALKEEGKIIE